MRTTIIIALSLIVVTGCSSTKSAQKPAPVVSERPSISKRIAFARQQEAAREVDGLTVVRGDVRR